ncbi:MAG: divalent-cation tolerance protein CutA [Deltaproteobacteria bacterium]|nr:divalent-cation tolerance protein CutA [Deltaproteobacteria bacterium]
MTAAVVILSTAGSRDEAERIAAALVEERLAACVNLVDPITSIYRWQGKVARAAEVLMVIKTRRARAARLTARLRALHGYDVPEAIVLPIASGSAPYLRWLAAETSAPRAKRRRRSAPAPPAPRSVRPRPR